MTPHIIYTSRSRSWKRPEAEARTPAGRRYDRLRTAGFVLVLAVLIAMGSFFKDVGVGQLLIGLYGLYAIVRRVPVDISVKMALVALATVALLTVMTPDSALIGTFTVYSLLLLVIAVVTGMLEQFRHR